MPLKQETAADDSAAVIMEITKLFGAINLPRLASDKLYLGIPFSILDSIRQALEMQLAQDEEKRFINRMRYAGITRERTANTFQWDDSTYPVVQTGAIEKALSIDFVHSRKNLVMVGPSGAGKSLLAIIVACKAIREGFSVKYKTANAIAIGLQEAKEGNSLSGYIKKLQGCDVLVIDDLTFASFDRKTAESFFSIIDGRYGRKTTIVTSNSNIKEWALEFPVKSMSSALLGRFYEDALLINMNGAKDMRLAQINGSTFGDDENSIAGAKDDNGCQ
jgi:DNA replication protein DnaC